jgi:multidrug transporter EmrE-like cation transporter
MVSIHRSRPLIFVKRKAGLISCFFDEVIKINQYQIVIHILLIIIYLVFIDISYKACKYSYSLKHSMKSIGFVVFAGFGVICWSVCCYLIFDIYDNQSTSVRVERIVSNSSTLKNAAHNINMRKIDCKQNPDELNCTAIKNTLSNMPDKITKNLNIESTLVNPRSDTPP